MSLVFTGCGKSDGNGAGFFTYRSGQAISSEKEGDGEALDKTKVSEPKQVESSLYVVKSIDYMDESIAFYSLNVSRDIRYKYNLTTKFLDKYGNSTSSSNFTPGTVVVVGDMLPSSGAVSSVQMASNVWTHTDVSRFSVDEELGMFSIADSRYKITRDTRIFSDEEEIEFSDITSQDVLTVVGLEDEIISVAVTTGHGYIELQNTSLFVDSLIFVGNKIVTMVHGDGIIEIPEGTYTITVANEGWGGSGEFTVVRNEVTPVDLDAMKGAGPSYCDLIFEVSVDECQVYLDGKLMPLNQSNLVRYGQHKLQVVADGYENWSKTLIVNSSSATISINLAEENTGSAATTDTTNNASNTSENDATGNNNTTTNGSQTTNIDSEVDYLTTISDLISTLIQ